MLNIRKHSLSRFPILMKKLSFLMITITLITLTGCTIKPQIQPWLQDTWTIVTDTIPYSWELNLAGLGPDESLEQTVSEDTLVIKKTFEDHSDHVFIDRQSWSNYLDIQNDIIPGNIVRFAGTVKALDAAAGNHYYQVATIDELKIIWQPTQTEVENMIEKYGYCETDNDCTGIYGQCPLSCQIAINKKYQTTVEKIITNFRNHQSPQCTYKCMEIKKVSCDNYKCVAE